MSRVLIEVRLPIAMMRSLAGPRRFLNNRGPTRARIPISPHKCSLRDGQCGIPGLSQHKWIMHGR